MLIVNYFPGSLGDTIISKLTSLPSWVDYLGSVKLDYPWNLKTVTFYQSTDIQKQIIFKAFLKPWLEKHKIIGAHRFESFDFKKFDSNINVLTIDPRQCLDYVAPMFITKVQKVVGYYDGKMQQLDQVLAEKYGKDNKLQLDLAKSQIVKWCEQNILDSDIVMDLSKFLNDANYVNQFQRLINEV